MSDLEQILAYFEEYLGLGVSTQQKIFLTVVALLLIWLVQFIIRRSLVENFQDQATRYQWNKTISYLAIFLSFVIVAFIWVEGLRSLATYLGLLSAGLAVALKDPLTDLVGWGFILSRKPFVVGDRIQIGDYAGDVIDQRFFKFSLMEIGNWVNADQSTGRVLHIPNSMIFTNVLANYTKGSDFIWNEIPVLVTFESDWEKAKSTLAKIADEQSQELIDNAEMSFRKAANQYMLRYGKLSSRVYTEVLESGVNLTIRYLCEPRNRRGSAEALWESILREFAKHDDIDFAYPTQRFYNPSIEANLAINARATNLK